MIAIGFQMYEYMIYEFDMIANGFQIHEYIQKYVSKLLFN